MNKISKTLAALVAATTLVSFNVYAVDSASDSGSNVTTGANADTDTGNAEASSLQPSDTEKKAEDKSCSYEGSCSRSKDDKSEE